MKKFNEYMKEQNQQQRDHAISKNLENQAKNHERVIDTSKNQSAVSNARSKFKKIQHRRLEHDLGISVQDFSKIFNKVHNKK